MKQLTDLIDEGSESERQKEEKKRQKEWMDAPEAHREKGRKKEHRIEYTAASSDFVWEEEVHSKLEASLGSTFTLGQGEVCFWSLNSPPLIH